jgi:hypothetical protein
MLHVNADVVQMVRIADAGQLQDLRGADGASGSDHLHRRVGALRGAAAREFDPNGALAIQNQPMHQGIRDDLQVRPVHRWA